MTRLAAEKILPVRASASSLRRLLLVGGGTGGHLTPGLALVEGALERFPGLKVTFFRTRRPIEETVLASSTIPMEMRELAANEGADFLLAKPFTAEDMEQALGMYVS